MVFTFTIQVEAAVAHVNVTITGDSTTVMAARIEEHQSALEKEFYAKADHQSSCQSKWQHADDNVKRYESKVDKQRRQQGQSCFNADGSLAFLGGFSGESHLRQPLEIIRDLQRYCLQEMLKLRQGRVEGYLHELIESMNHDILTGKFEDKTKEHQHLRQNLWATQNVLSSIQRRIGAAHSKADIIRKVVRTINYFKTSFSKVSGIQPISISFITTQVKALLTVYNIQKAHLEFIPWWYLMG